MAEKLAQRARVFASRPALGTFVVMFVIINVAYFAYGVGFAIIKWTRTATSVACPWPYPEAKVYDPQGFYEENGQPGPYSVGIWSTWMSAQPDGRPDVELGADSDRCAPHESRMAETAQRRHHRSLARARVRLRRAPVQAGLAGGRRDAVG